MCSKLMSMQKLSVVMYAMHVLGLAESLLRIWRPCTVTVGDQVVLVMVLVGLGVEAVEVRAVQVAVAEVLGPVAIGEVAGVAGVLGALAEAGVVVVAVVMEGAVAAVVEAGVEVATVQAVAPVPDEGELAENDKRVHSS